jgi:2-oxoisovalerate dehydrogenase E1 component
VLRDIPGLVIASPATRAMRRRCCAPARRGCRVDGTVSVFLEPIALYHTRDLHSADDGGWTAPYVAPSRWGGARADRSGASGAPAATTS